MTALADHRFCTTRTGRTFDVRDFAVDRIECVNDADDLLAALASRKVSIQKRLSELRTVKPLPEGDIKRASDALAWCDLRAAQVRTRKAFLRADGDQNWSTIGLAQRFMEAARAHLGSETYALIMADAKRRHEGRS